MTDSPDSDVRQPAPRKRRLLKRALAAGGIAAVLAVAFHRPLLRFAIDYGGRKAAQSQGMALTWDVSGSVTGGLQIDHAEVRGEPGAPVRSLRLDHLRLGYDPWEWRKSGPGGIVQEIAIHGLTADLDLSAPAKKPKPPAKPRGEPSAPPAVRIPRIDLRDINLTIRQPDGEIEVRGLTLLIDPASPGEISADEIRIPGLEPLADVRGTTAATPQSLTLTDLTLWTGVVVESLAVDLAQLPQTRIPLAVRARQGDAAVQINATVDAATDGLPVAGSVAATGVTWETLQRWGIPDGGSHWHARRLDLAVDGPVLRPDRLTASLDLDIGRFATGPVGWDGGRLQVAIGDGRLKLDPLEILAGPDSVRVTGDVALPDSWADMAEASGRAQWTLSAPDLARLAPPETAIDGSAAGTGEVTLTNGSPEALTASLTGQSLEISGIPVERVALEAAGDARTIRLTDARILLNAQNTVTATASLNLTGAREVSAQWQANCPDLSTIPADVRDRAKMWPAAGSVSSSGSLEGSLEALESQDWERFAATAQLAAANLRIDEASLQSLKLEAAATNGQATLQALDVAFDERNRVSATGSAALTGDGAFDLRAGIDLPNLAALTAWSQLGGGPAIRSGLAEVAWTGRGTWRNARIDGNGTVRVADLHLDGVPETLAAAAEIRQSGSAIAVPEWNASAGPWRAGGALEWTGSRLEVPSLEAFARSEKLLTLTASLPLAGGDGDGGDGGPIPPDEPLQVSLNARDLDLSAIAAAIGRQFPVAGRLNAALTAGGTLRHLQASLAVDADGLQPVAEGAPKLRPADLHLQAAVDGGKLALDGTVHQRPLNALTLSGSLPFDAAAVLDDPAWLNDKPLRLTATLPESGLSFLPEVVPALTSVTGTTAVDAALSGTLSRPEWHGEVRVNVPALSLDRASLPTVKDLNLRVRADGYRISLDQASVVLAGGRLQLTGGAGLTDPADPSLDLRLRADQVLVVRDEAVSLRADGDIACRGELSQANVRGTVDLVRGRVFKEIEYLPLSLPNQLPPPPPPVRASKDDGPPALSPPLDKWAFDIGIRTRDPIRLMGNVARGGIVADLHVGGTGAGPELTGNVDLSDVWVKLPYSRVTFPEAKVLFTREAPFDPRIDIRGESMVGDRQVFLNVQGRALDPMIRFSSSPPLPEGEIATLLATGVTTSDLQGSGDVAAGRAAVLLIRDLYRKTFRKKDRPSDDDEPPRLTFDFSLMGSDHNGRSISAIYELSPRWRTIGRVSEAGTFRGLLYYLIRFR